MFICGQYVFVLLVLQLIQLCAKAIDPGAFTTAVMSAGAGLGVAYIQADIIDDLKYCVSCRVDCFVLNIRYRAAIIGLARITDEIVSIKLV